MVVSSEDVVDVLKLWTVKFPVKRPKVVAKPVFGLLDRFLELVNLVAEIFNSAFELTVVTCGLHVVCHLCSA